jgi:hypothetical protein
VRKVGKLIQADEGGRAFQRMGGAENIVDDLDIVRIFLLFQKILIELLKLFVRFFQEYILIFTERKGHSQTPFFSLASNLLPGTICSADSI